ncbi:sensor histidine kinase [Photobacterium sp. DNB22_13_2]
MKIRPSLRLHFLLAMLLTGTITIIAMSAVSLSYFFSGMDLAMSGMMHSQAFQQDIRDGQPQQIRNINVASRWEDLPISIRQNLDQKDLVEGELLKKIEGIPLIEHPKAGYFAMKATEEGETRYISMTFPEKPPEHLPPRASRQFVYLILTACLAIIIFASILVFTLRGVATPVEALKDWAKSLNKEKLSLPVPDFHFGELNTLANIIQSSLSSVQESLDREQRFLGYASHELRTPIAVTRTNAELLRKMIIKGVDNKKQIDVLDRIERAGFTMTNLTETLLWLNRQEEKALPTQNIIIGELTQQITQELNYLLGGKSVDVEMRTDNTYNQQPESLCRIIISNLIRNAFQHTNDGKVEILQSGHQLTIINKNHSAQHTADDLGFGLGLELTERLIKQYGWQYDSIELESGRKVRVQFNALNEHQK